jgi:acyl-CoA hydrolase
MAIPAEKPVSASSTEQVHIVMPAHTNGCGRLFGGQLMEWIDIVAAVCARRHSEKDVVTVCVDGLDFAAAAFMNQIIVLSAEVTYVGHTSMEVRVDSFAEDAHGIRTPINRAYLVLVAVDDKGEPAEVPALVFDLAEQESEYNGAVVRAASRRKRRDMKLAGTFGADPASI